MLKELAMKRGQTVGHIAREGIGIGRYICCGFEGYYWDPITCTQQGQNQMRSHGFWIAKRKRIEDHEGKEEYSYA